MSSSDEAVTDEIMEIFSEEVAEVLTLIDENFSAWKQNPDNDRALKEVRRAFHTLKGSGRMVQAMELGELAWSIENLLNNVINGSQKPVQAIFDLLTDIRPVIPQLLTAFENGQSASDVGVALSSFIQRAEDIPLNKAPAFDPQTGRETEASTAEEDANEQAVKSAELDVLTVRVNQFDDQLVKLKAQLTSLNGELQIIQKLQQSSPKRQEVEAVKRQSDTLGRELNDLKYFVKNTGEQVASQIQEVQQQSQKNVSDKLGDLSRTEQGMMNDLEERLKQHGRQMTMVAIRAAGGAFVLSAIMILALRLV